MGINVNPIKKNSAVNTSKNPLKYERLFINNFLKFNFPKKKIDMRISKLVNIPRTKIILNNEKSSPVLFTVYLVIVSLIENDSVLKSIKKIPLN